MIGLLLMVLSSDEFLVCFGIDWGRFRRRAVHTFVHHQAEEMTILNSRAGCPIKALG